MMAAMGKLKVEISIHFLYTEEDEIPLVISMRQAVFQSTSSIQRKTSVEWINFFFL